MLGMFPSDQTPSDKMLRDVQLVLDEAVALVVTHGGQLPDFSTQIGRIAAAYGRLGPDRVDQLSRQHAAVHEIDVLVPLIAKTWTQLDALKQRAITSFDVFAQPSKAE